MDRKGSKPWGSLLARVARLSLAVAALGAASAAQAQASDYPSKPIKFVVSSPSGGVVDIRARRFGVRLSELLKQPIIVENRPGASTTIGADFVAKSAPDGYTALFGGNNEVVFVPALGMPIRYDPVNDLIPVAQFTLGYPVLVAHTGMGVKSIAQLVEWVKARPNQLLCGTSGHGSGQHFVCELLGRALGSPVRSVPYKGTGPMLVDTAGGQVHISIGFLAEVDKQYIQSGKVVPLAVLAPRRIARFPDLPTMGELGYPGFELMSWTGLFVPAGTPRPIVNRLNAEITKVVREPEFSSWLNDTGSEVVTPTPEQFREFTRSELARWKKNSDDLNIKYEQ